MPPRKTSKRPPSKEEVKAKADRAEGKKGPRKSTLDPMDPPEVTEDLELVPGGVTMRVKRDGRGRPTVYKPEYAKIADAMLKLGATVSELAALFDVSNMTIYRWQQTYPEFCDAFCDLNEKMDSRVERALWERAVGYTYDAVKIFQYEGDPVIVPHKVHVPPDVTAGKLYLSARKPEKWRDKDSEALTGAGEAFLGLLRGMSGKKNAPKA